MTKFSITLASLTSAALLALGAPALASHGGDDNGGGGGNDDRLVKTGSCSDGARWKLKVKTDDGGLEVEGEVDSNRSGQSWAWKIKDNGSIAARGTSDTRGASGSFSVERTIADRSGTDKVVFRASHAGEVCRGALSF